MDLSPTTKNTEFGYINPKTTYISTPCPGDATILFGFRKNFPTCRMVVEPRNKVKIKKVFPLFTSFLFLLCCLQRQEDASKLKSRIEPANSR